MSSPIERRRLLLGGAALGALPASASAQSDGDILEIRTSETATIDGRQWDKPMVGGTTFDAVHRSVLLRFPTAGDQIAAFLRRGRVLVGAELVLHYAGYEIVPADYTCRDGLGRKVWTENPPTWHVLAAPLRKPWAADAETGPTFNASVNGLRYWTRFGAGDPQADRVFDLFEPQELSKERTEARIDITKMLATPALEREAGERLRALDHQGFVLRKLETYDTRYRQEDAYEWAMPIGGHGLTFDAPKLAITTRRTDGSVDIAMPTGLQGDWKTHSKDGSKPTAVLPDLQQVMEATKRALFLPGADRTTGEATRVAELLKEGGDNTASWTTFRDAGSYEDYARNVEERLRIVPRYWVGWEVQDYLLLPLILPNLLPAQLMEHMKNYWRAWLQPDLPTNAFVNPQSREAIEYWQKTHDWRGRASFFRDGYNYAVSTQNFNHTAAMGALLGGTLIGSQYAIADGRHGLEHLALRFWSFLDGGTQELLDHYYLSITLSSQKMFCDFGPTAVDRLMGRILVDRTMELLITGYHPHTRRFIAPSGRARLSGVLVEQDGIYSALHTVSKEGVVNYLGMPPKDKMDERRVHGMPVWGYDFPPARASLQTLASSWAPLWVADLVDDKPVPFEHTSTETTRGNFKPPLWRRSWIGRWHGLASSDVKGGTIDVMAQWVRAPRKATKLEDLGTLTMRYHANTPDLATTDGGLYSAAGLPLTFQSRNRAIVFAKPYNNPERFLRGVKGDLSVLATVVGLWNFNDRPDWELFVDGEKITSFPYRMRFNQRLLIRDGVTYLALLPLPATDLGRDAEIEIGPGGSGRGDFSKADIAPALIVSMFNMKRAKGTPVRELDFAKLLNETYGGFVLEMGDAEQYGSFEKFAKHIGKCQLSAAWNARDKRLDVTYRSGGDLMEAGFGTDFGQPSEVHFAINPGSQEAAFPYRRLNGQWPYLPPGLERDTTWSQQGTTGKLEKNGATLLTEPGRKAYLLSDPVGGAVVGYNPLPDPQSWKLTTKDGKTFAADGKLALLRVEYRPWSHEVLISHAPKEDQAGSGDLAHNFSLKGFTAPPKVTLNGKTVRPVSRDGQYWVTL